MAELVLQATWNEPVQAGLHFKNVVAPWCKLIVAVCEQLGVACHSISPAGKGRKLDAANFKRITAWAKQSNQHERDACMVAWPYRNVARYE